MLFSGHYHWLVIVLTTIFYTKDGLPSQSLLHRICHRFLLLCSRNNDIFRKLFLCAIVPEALVRFLPIPLSWIWLYFYFVRSEEHTSELQSSEYIIYLL